MLATTGGYTLPGGIAITATDNAGNHKTFHLDIKLRIDDTTGPVLSQPGSIAAVNMETNDQDDSVVNVTFVAIDPNGLDTTASGREVERLNGNGTENLTLDGNNLKLTVTHDRDNYIANNQYITEHWRVRIKDGLGNFSAWKEVSWLVKLFDNTPPTLVVKGAPPVFNFNSDSSSEVTATGQLTITDNRSAIDESTFRVSGNTSHVSSNQPSNALTHLSGNDYEYKLKLSKGSMGGKTEKRTTSYFICKRCI